MNDERQRLFDEAISHIGDAMDALASLDIEEAVEWHSRLYYLYEDMGNTVANMSEDEEDEDAAFSHADWTPSEID
jgi:hypothetical protein